MTADWRDSANCLGCDTDAWFPEGTAPYPAIAREVCASCPVLEDCRSWVLDHERDLGLHSRFGMFAGMTPFERWDATRNTDEPRGGRQPIAPCGTLAAYKRHRRNGEPTDEACRRAMAVDSVSRRRRTAS